MSADKDTGTGRKKKSAPAKTTEDSPNGHRDAGSVAHVVDKARAEAMRANMSAIATADVGTLQTTGCAVGIASVGGDVEISTGATGLVSAQGDADVHQAWMGALIGNGDVSVTQGGANVIVARDCTLDTGAAVTVVAAEATASKAWIGFLISPKATVSEDSRVFIDAAAALIIGAAVLIGFALLAFAGVRTARDVMAWRPKLPGLHWS